MLTRHRGKTPTRGEQVLRHRLGKQHPSVLGQQPEHAALIDQMPSNRLSIQQLTLIKRTTLHASSISGHENPARSLALCSAVS